MKLFLLINFIVFQLCWFLAAIYQQSAVGVMLGLLCIHFAFSPTKLADIKVLPIALVGILVDQLLIHLHVIQLPVNTATPLVIPLTLVLLWCVFSWCFNHSLNWLTNISLKKAAVLGGVFGSLSYTSALKLDVFSSTLPLLYFVLIFTVIWTLLLPLFIRMHLFILK